MEPAVMNNNLVLLNRASYWIMPPAYGDIVVFRSSVFTDNGEGKMLVKRVIGIENDEIEIVEGKVHRNGRVIEENYAVGLNPEENMEKIKIAKGRVFVLGDHRDVSLDSRDKSIGQVQVSDIVGRVSMRLLPFSEMERL
jgi:signal peptidase I